MSNVFEFTDYAFRIEGMHCIKCIRKVQYVADHYQDIKNLNVDLGKKMITACAKKDFPVEDFKSELESKGFGVFSIALNVDEISKSSLDKDMIKKIGVAGACAGNIMLLAAAEYSGASIIGWPHIFKILSLAFFVPVLFYSSLPLYYSSWFALKARKISIDAPIVLALIGGAFLSLYNMFKFNQGHVYFDSLSMFVFFLLSSRYIVQIIQSKYTSAVSIKDVISQSRVARLENGIMKSVELIDINIGDIINVSKGGYLAFDGVLYSEKAVVSDAFYSGEAYPKTKKKLEKIYAGSKNLGSEFKLKVSHTKDETRLSKIINMLNLSLKSKTHLSSLADQGAKLLTILIILAAGLIFMYYSIISLNIEEGVNRVLALLVVACPCGLAIATPLVQTLGIKMALKKSLLVKDVSVFESLKSIDTVFFDKTGTLTKGEINLTKFSPREPSEYEKQIIYNLEEKSEHPIAKALRLFTKEQASLKLSDYQEIGGVGVLAKIDNAVYSIESAKGILSRLVFMKDYEPQFYIHIEDEVEEGAKSVISYFRANSIPTFIISGDKKSEALRIAHKLNIPEKNVYYEKSPYEKAEIVKKRPGKSLYYGDGINDSLAMSHSAVSVSMCSSADLAFKSSKVHILEGGVSKSLSLFKLSNNAYFSMKIIIAISIVYNLIFAALAALGFIKPLIAVIIMPLSSISITFLGLYLMATNSEFKKDKKK